MLLRTLHLYYMRVFEIRESVTFAFSDTLSQTTEGKVDKHVLTNNKITGDNAS